MDRGHEHERQGCGPSLAERQVAALERIAHNTGHLARELAATQDVLEIVARHLIGGLSPEETADARAEVQKLRQELRQSRLGLAAAIAADHHQPPTHPRQP